jgi:hypothetical protein
MIHSFLSDVSQHLKSSTTFSHWLPKKQQCSLLCLCLMFCTNSLLAQSTPFELSKGMETATYETCIDYYMQLAKQHPTQMQLKTMGPTDDGHPLHLVILGATPKSNPAQWRQSGKTIVLVNNGIHPGEPDGIDASMLLVRQYLQHKKPAPEKWQQLNALPQNMVVCFIPVYNIGGARNRNAFTRVNQNGPSSHGFRGNAQNLDLNRDFTKCDSKEAQSFTQIFQWLQPDVFIDNHVSDGADYQHTMTLLSTNYSKSAMGELMRRQMDPAIFNSMEKDGFPICPYVNFEDANPDSGFAAFYDPPRYSSGYATLFNTIAYVPETHMLKPFKDRVISTFLLMKNIINATSEFANAIQQQKKQAFLQQAKASSWPLSWTVDSTKADTIRFMGYAAKTTTSKVTGQQRLFYDHNTPFDKQIKFYDYFSPNNIVVIPKAYVLPRGWTTVVDRLQLNGVQMRQLQRDTTIEVEAYRIEDYKSFPRAYEKHHKNYNVKTSSKTKKQLLLKGDWIIPTNQAARRYLVEMLEPSGDDSFFAWNFFDAILQQKEGYSDYRWEDVAAQYLQTQPELQKQLAEKKKQDAKFAADAAAQLNFIYKNSPWYEPAHLQYPVYRIMQ